MGRRAYPYTEGNRAADGKKFKEWDVAYNNVTADLIVTAVYENVSKGGCGGSIVLGTSIAAGVALVGVAAALMLRKKKRG